jgi:hypothetical protein
VITINGKVASPEHHGGIVGRVTRREIDDHGRLEAFVVRWDEIGASAVWRWPAKNTFREVR